MTINTIFFIDHVDISNFSPFYLKI